jgi:S-formylglutathione hydrolase FrmB
MAFIQASFFSPVLQKQTSLYAIVPESGRGPFPVFYLLHGLSDDHTIWHRRTRIEEYVAKLPLIVVMPDGYRGWYTDNEDGPAYARYMLEDVIGFAERTFPAIGKRSARCIGGLSMGGYGALRLGLGFPEQFVSVNSHSGAVGYSHKGGPFHHGDMARVFGTHSRGTDHDVFALASKVVRKKAPLPKVLIDCGTEDVLIEQNREYTAHLKKIGYAHEYREFPGVHDWPYWDAHVPEALAFHAAALKIKQAQ